ncbi:hypothetical protein OV079_52660 [Nannocystis pusilla]|uniref:Uncharacterized protein n=1 Tax=Nannocystis pusilla TaxID=889268 RepID=A0A9X3J3Q7_9BACT|nr:hypothetical protein [Nannocystis pusilla]MCY1014036.1 hypothetical protein [Nannocystis pusilla]
MTLAAADVDPGAADDVVGDADADTGLAEHRQARVRKADQIGLELHPSPQRLAREDLVAQGEELADQRRRQEQRLAPWSTRWTIRGCGASVRA